jgi:hypothetical protein
MLTVRVHNKVTVSKSTFIAKIITLSLSDCASALSQTPVSGPANDFDRRCT